MEPLHLQHQTHYGGMLCEVRYDSRIVGFCYHQSTVGRKISNKCKAAAYGFCQGYLPAPGADMESRGNESRDGLSLLSTHPSINPLIHPSIHPFIHYWFMKSLERISGSVRQENILDGIPIHQRAQKHRLWHI